MTTQKKPRKKVATKKQASSRSVAKPAPTVEVSGVWPVRIWRKLRQRVDGLLSRRAHRSFRRTRRRDYVRTLALPGYWSFSRYVLRTLATHRRLFLLLGLVFAVMTAAMAGVTSQEQYTKLTDAVQQTGQTIFEGAWGQIGQAGLLVLASLNGAASPAVTEPQQIYSTILALLLWLTSVWLLRNLLAGATVRLRDGLYNAGAPIVATSIVILVGLVQLLPVAVAFLAYTTAESVGMLDGGVIGMLFWAVAGLLAVLSLYWLTSTFMAAVIVTLPGMYPFQALRVAGDLVLGRRMRILLRVLWAFLGVIVTWVIVAIPVVLLDTALKAALPGLSWLPLVPVVFLALSTLSLIWMASYIYLLYRRIVADDSAAANA